MNLLYVSHGSRVFEDENGTKYLNHHITNAGFRKFLDFPNVKLTILLRYMGKVSNGFAKKNCEKFDTTVGTLLTYDNLFSRKNFLSISKRKKIKKIIENAVADSDFVICAVGSGYVAEAVKKYAKKYKKQYLVTCLGYTFEGFWHHGLSGKLLAIPSEISCKSTMKSAPYVIYVTQEACQKRYPTKGISLGCSDVEIEDLNEGILENRLTKISTKKENKSVIGTAASVDVKWKGQYIALKAVKRLLNNGYDVEYQMIGLGSPKKILQLAKRLKIDKHVRYLGSLHHEEVFKWMDNLDIYLQPSFQEGLCRSIVEAMSRACPVICTDVGGNYELVESKYLCQKGNYNQIASKIIQINNELIAAAKRNFDKAHEYEINYLKEKKYQFLNSIFSQYK